MKTKLFALIALAALGCAGCGTVTIENQDSTGKVISRTKGSAVAVLLRDGGSIVVKSTTFGLVIGENIASQLYELKLGLVRNEIDIASANANVSSATSVQTIGFNKGRLQTVYGFGTNGVWAAASSNLMPFADDSLATLESKLPVGNK